MYREDIFYNSRYNVVLYPYARCNLNCSYCFIDKNPSLKAIDDVIAKSFEDPIYYKDFMLEFVRPDKCTLLQFWGGEPTLGFSRLVDVLPLLFETFPRLSEIRTSSNFTTPSFVDDIFVLLDAMSKYLYKGRYFNFNLQCSYDGKGEITDINRGKDVSRRIKENIKRLCDRLKECESRLYNIRLLIHTKPTMDAVTMRMIGDSDTSIVDYWKDLKEIRDMVRSYDFRKMSVDFQPCQLTVAEPSPWTMEDGLYFADFCKRSRLLMEDNRELVDSTCAFVPYFRRDFSMSNSRFQKRVDKIYGFCNLAFGQIGFLPDDTISLCHSAFVEIIKGYKEKSAEQIGKEHTLVGGFFRNYVDSPMIFHKKDFCVMNDKMLGMRENAKSLIYANATVLNTMAHAGLVDPKYKNEDLAFDGAARLAEIVPVCYRNQFNVEGVLSVGNPGELKLFCNGALEVISDEWYRNL